MRLILTVAYLLLVSLFVLRKGGQPERLVLSSLVISDLVDALYHRLAGPAQFDVVLPAHLLIDSAMLVCLMWIALRANRAWPMWVASAQLIMMLGHLGKLLEMREAFRGYWAMTQVPPLLQLAFLTIGTAAHVWRQRAIGPYHSWRLA